MLVEVRCVDCKSGNVYVSRKYQTQNHGERKLYKCRDCKILFSETKGTVLENVQKPSEFIIQVLKARSEGLGFNATARVFAIARNTLRNWEKKFTQVKQELYPMALT